MACVSLKNNIVCGKWWHLTQTYSLAIVLHQWQFTNLTIEIPSDR